MKAYIYCSYKFSPVGFQMGTIEYNPSSVEDYIPNNDSLDKFVVTAFEQGIVRKVYGLNPNNSKFVYLVKDMKKSNVVDDNEGEIDIYMNLAFEFDNFDDYKNFSTNFDNLSEQAAEECSKFIAPDRSVKTYALKVKFAEFNSFIERMLVSTGSNFSDDKSIYVEVVPSKPQESKLESAFRFDFENLGDKKYRHPIKKKFPVQSQQGPYTSNVIR